MDGAEERDSRMGVVVEVDGARLRRRRRRRGLTMEIGGETAEVSLETIWRLEKGRTVRWIVIGIA